MDQFTTDEVVDIFDGEVVEDDSVIDFSNLEDVPEDTGNILIEPANNVRLSICQAKVIEMSEGKLKKINIQFRLEDGVDETGKYRGAKFWQNGQFFDNFFFYADPATYTSKYWVEKKHLSNLKTLMKATQVAQLDMKDLQGTLVGKELIGTVVQVANQKKNEETGEYEDDGTFANCARYLKPVA